MAEEGVPACDTISHHVIPTERAGALNVWVQGDLGKFFMITNFWTSDFFMHQSLHAYGLTG